MTTSVRSGKPRLKPLREQVVVIIGASSGIGRQSALRLAARGAKVVVAARSEPGLASLVAEIKDAGGEAAYVVCDVTDFEQVEAVADLAVERYGRIDTWVHAAAVGVYDTIERIPQDDFRRVLEINVMGYLHGVQSALPHLRRAGQGAFIFISSVESTVAMPMQGAYVTSKHGIQGMAEALRRELLHERVPISITSVKPTVINTPFYDNARSNIGFAPTVPAPHYHPSVVAECVCYAAENPVRDIMAGGTGKVIATLQIFAPGLVDIVLGRIGVALQRTRKPAGEDSLYEPRIDDNRVVGSQGLHAFRFSPYTWLQTHPKAKATANVLAAGLILRGIRRRG